MPLAQIQDAEFDAEAMANGVHRDTLPLHAPLVNVHGVLPMEVVVAVSAPLPVWAGCGGARNPPVENVVFRTPHVIGEMVCWWHGYSVMFVPSPLVQEL
jgi:hypothetical protein